MLDVFSSKDKLFDFDEVAGKVSGHTERPFMPWHKPRKQHIRKQQWVKQLKRILKTTAYKHIETINYFGLPGGDLLDVTYISEQLSPENSGVTKNLRINGFISSVEEYKKAEANISKLLDRPNISADSKIERYRFEDLRDKKSSAWQSINKLGNSHFINLDFCDCVFTKDTISSIYLLLNHQFSTTHLTPWILCITTRLNKCPSAVELLSRDEFKELFTEVNFEDSTYKFINITYDEIICAIETIQIDDSSVSESDANQLLQLCLLLWLIKESIRKDSKIELKSSYKYGIDPLNTLQDMHSFVFKLQKIDITEPDILNLTKIEPAEKLNAEKIRINCIKVLERTKNVDQYLEEQPEVLKQLAKETMQLLDSCGYNTSNYLKEMNALGYQQLPINREEL